MLSIISSIVFSIGDAILAYIVMRYYIESGQLTDLDKGVINGRSTAIRTILFMAFIASIAGLAALILKGFITYVKE